MRSRSPSLLGLLLLTGLAAGLAGCGSEPVSGGACRTNQNCPTGEQCVGGRCLGATPLGCKNDDACEPGQYCDLSDGACKTMEVVLCSADADCPADQRCNTLTGVCIRGNRGCTAEADCAAAGKHCDLAQQLCVDCVDATHCPAGQACTANRCEDPSPTGCALDAECGAPEQVCESTRCVPGCGRPSSPITCRPGSFCNTSSGRCDTGNVSCSADVDCGPPSSVCESGQCIPGCTQVGGLVCTGGWACNARSGRCEPPAGCSTDAQCGAPASVCEGQRCVPGCGQPGGTRCGAGTVCDGGTGRCVAVSGPCQSDAQCGAPSRVCESGQCVPGCAQPGGVQCAGATVCNAGSGRCVPGGGGGCVSDAQCSPPSTVCNLASGACVAGCGASGCAPGQVCNAATGQCQGGGGNPGGGALNATCVAGADCASGVCFDLGAGIGPRCVQSCGRSADCPASFTCYDFAGGKMCISSQLFQGASFAGAPGSACTEGGQCRSNFCPQYQCAETCSEDGDCGGGACQWHEYTLEAYTAACVGPAGPGGNGASCAADADCRGGVCYGAGTCGGLCGSSADCPSGNVCAPVNYSICRLDLGAVCLEWAPYIVKACVAQPHGATPMGSPCADAGGSNCRDGFCYGPSNQCTGLCSRDADCPASMVCGVEQLGDLDGQPVYTNVCVPR